MQLLIVTQVIDTEHPILGFFHRWVEEFAKNCAEVTVICQAEGNHNLPANVKVLSLGKELGASKLKQLLNFYQYIWSERKSYDAVFVHMIPLYVLLGGPIWRLLRKKTSLWYAHGSVTLQLRIAILFSNNVFTSTKEGLKVKTRKSLIVGQGIDTVLFSNKDRVQSSPLKLITVGRIASSKNIDTLLQACASFGESGVDYKFQIVGFAITDEEKQYQEELHKLVNELGLGENVEWVGNVTQSKLPEYLQEADIFIHDSSTNSLDKALLEAVLCGCLVTTSNPAYSALAMSYTPELLFSPRDNKKLATIINDLSIKSPNHRSELMKSVREEISSSHTINKLISGIVSQLDKHQV